MTPATWLSSLRNRGAIIESRQPASQFKSRSARPSRTIQRGDAGLLSAAPFVEGIYLHQVVEKAERFTRYTDLPEGLSEEPGLAAAREEWRIHFHVPIFLDQMKNFSTTQDHLVSLIDLIKRDPVCPYLEVETYTWDVLPVEYRTLDVASAVARELAWVRDRIEL